MKGNRGDRREIEGEMAGIPPVERRSTSAWWGPLSPQSVTRFSEKARRVPLEVLMMLGMLRAGGRERREDWVRVC